MLPMTNAQTSVRARSRATCAAASARGHGAQQGSRPRAQRPRWSVLTSSLRPGHVHTRASRRAAARGEAQAIPAGRRRIAGIIWSCPALNSCSRDSLRRDVDEGGDVAQLLVAELSVNGGMSPLPWTSTWKTLLNVSRLVSKFTPRVARFATVPAALSVWQPPQLALKSFLPATTSPFGAAAGRAVATETGARRGRAGQEGRYAEPADE